MNKQKDRPWWWNFFFKIKSYRDGLTRRRLPVTLYGGSFPHRGFVEAIRLPNYEYWCKCGQKLEEGPCDGMSVNAVCKKCRINYGCLYGFFGYFAGE